MKTKYLSFPKQILMSLLLFSILLGFEVKPARAQWTVFDPSQYALQLSKKIEEATRWVETVNQYLAMYENAVKQYEKMIESVSNLRGILDKVDEQISRHKQLITTYSQLGKLIRGIYELRRRVENTITSQIQSIVNISRRLNQRFISFLHRIPICAVKLFIIKIVAHCSPALFENFHFFLGKTDVHIQIQCQRAHFSPIHRNDLDSPVFEIINLF